MKPIPILLSALAVCAFLLLNVAPIHAADSDYRVYFGTYTVRGSHGIYVSRMDANRGTLSAPELAAETESPSFVVLHPNRRFLYAVNEVGSFHGQKSGAVSAFAVDAATGKLKLLNQVPSGGAGPCHLAVDRSGKYVLVANYDGGSIASFPIRGDGGLDPAVSFIQLTGSGPDRERQEAPHAHFVALSADNRFAILCDLGTDQIRVYRFDGATGHLTPNDPAAVALPPGSGPRHFTFDTGGRYGYSINELKSTVSAFAWDGHRGALTLLQTISALAPGFSGQSSAAEIAISPSDRFLYGSNRGEDTIAVFAIDARTGRLTASGRTSTQGKTPRGFGLDPSGRWLIAANQDSDNVVVFRIGASGVPSPAGQTVQVGSPVCVQVIRP